jgi:uncharacterized repeat protein (TIGR01451 family)
MRPRSDIGSSELGTADLPIEPDGEWEGILEAVVVDDFQRGRSETRWRLRTPGPLLETFFAGRPPNASGSAVRVSGLKVGNRLAVSHLTAALTSTAECKTTGEQKIAVVMLTTPSQPTLPPEFTAVNLQRAFAGSPSDVKSTDSVNAAWREMSYGQTSATAQVFGPYMLPRDYTCDETEELTSEAIRLADTAVDFRQFDHFSIVWPVGSCSFGGMNSLGCRTATSPSRGSFSASIGWLPAFAHGSPNVGLYVHELGHGLGMSHASSADYGPAPLGPLGVPGTRGEYGDPFSTMGYSYPLGQYGAQHKSQVLHWLSLNNYREVTTSGSYEVKPLETTADPRALRILRDPASSAWLWVEYRQPIGDLDANVSSIFGGSAFNGALIHYEDPWLSSLHTFLLDFTPSAIPNGFQDAALAPGRQWSDPYSLLTLTVNEPTPGGLPVNVNYDPPCASATYSSVSFPAAGGTGSITVSAPPTCSWTASTVAGWITFVGAASGTGNGVVYFTVGQNLDEDQRNTYITLQRQSTPILQTGGGAAVVDVTPRYGSGSSAQITWRFFHPNGAANIPHVSLRFEGSPACDMWVFISGKTVYLNDLYGSASLSLNSPGAVASVSTCSVSASGSSIVVSGNDLSVTLQMNFLAAFGGGRRISAKTPTLNYIPLGTWMVPAVQPPGVTIQSNTSGAPFILDGGSVYQAPVTFYWTPGSQHTVQWLSSDAARPGARYVFQNWADGGFNPRTITTPASSATFTASILAQYRLTVNNSPVAGGTTTVAPASADGYYNSGTSVTLTAAAASGYRFWYFSGDASGSAPATVALSTPRNVTANFACDYQNLGWLPYQVGPGPTGGFIQWQTGPGCVWSASSNAAWLIAGSPSSGSGSGRVSYSIAENTGAARSATLTFTGSDGLRWLMDVTQKAAGSALPTIVSITPNSGSGQFQGFTAQFHHAAGYNRINYGQISFGSADSLAACRVSFSNYSGGTSVSLSDQTNWQGSLNLPATSMLQNANCQLDGARSSISGGGNLLNVTIVLTFRAGFSGEKRIDGYAGDSTAGISSVSHNIGSWTVPSTPQAAVTITSNVVGAPFALEDSVIYRSPITFFWNPGAQHTVTWRSTLAGQSGTRYIFQDWTDSAANPRTISVPPGSVTYNARLKAQYQLVTTISTLGSGTVAIDPVSPDGYYDADAVVKLSATAAPGYTFSYFTGDSFGFSPLNVTMTASRNITAMFRCSYQMPNWIPSTVGPGPSTALWQWQTGPGCVWAVSSNVPWFAIAAPSSGTGQGQIQYSIAENTGSSRTGKVTLTGSDSYVWSIDITQRESSAALPSVVSVTPGSGSGLSQSFTTQFHNPAGFARINYGRIAFESSDGSSACNAHFSHFGSSASVQLNDGAGNWTTSLTLPSTATLEIGNCRLDGAPSSIAGTGKLLNVTLALTFKTPFRGLKRISAYAGDSTSSLSSATQTIGTWTVPGGLAIYKTHSGNFTQGQAGATYTVTVSNPPGMAATSGTVTVTETVPSGMTLVSMAGTGWNCPAAGTTCSRADSLNGGASYPPITVTVNVAANAASFLTNSVSVSGGGSATASTTDVATISPLQGLRFVPVPPCRIADTRKTPGPFGGPQLSAGSDRTFLIPNGPCNIPPEARAFSLNVAVVPAGPLGYVTVWPAAEPRPLTATLNSLDGRIKSNAAIVPADSTGAIRVFASNTTHVILDINGYFVPATDPTALAFFPIAPCRVADTRNPAAPLGGPSLNGGQSRSFPVLSAAACNIPPAAQAYSLNFAAVPKGPLGYLTAWSTGQPQPAVASLNAPTGAITANAAIVPAGASGAIDVFASNSTDLVIDINGYFAPFATGGLSFYNITPCRILDSRQPAGSPPLAGVRAIPVTAGPCGVPAAARAHVLNATVIPQGPLGYLTLWPHAQPQPTVSTLNALDGVITSNLALVPTTDGNISAFPSNPAHLVLDVFGYFAQ